MLTHNSFWLLLIIYLFFIQCDGYFAAVLWRSPAVLMLKTWLSELTALLLNLLDQDTFEDTFLILTNNEHDALTSHETCWCLSCGILTAQPQGWAMQWKLI